RRHFLPLNQNNRYSPRHPCLYRTLLEQGHLGHVGVLAAMVLSVEQQEAKRQATVGQRTNSHTMRREIDG
ncbi:hypothetical protein, partial [Escherichia coli]|uniref:hypothetical protein n=1 Tax=Escherichia coli TaxID=562 RepID=UPI001F1890CF